VTASVPVPVDAPVRAPGRARLLPVVLVAVAVGLAGYGVRLAVLLHTDGLLGSSAYDDGVYYAAAASFVHGRWPYADFLFLQPPAVLLAGAPFAALGGIAGDPTGVVVARLVWIGVGAANCALVAILAGRRSWPAGLVAGAFAACFFPLAYGERSTLLEPLGTLLLLLALLMQQRGGRRAALVAGALAGISIDVKIWYVVPVLVLAALAGHRIRFLLGALAGGGIVVAPFLIRAPEALVRQVVTDQLGRPRLPDDRVGDRLTMLTGAPWMQGAQGIRPPDAIGAAIVVGVVLVAAGVAAWRTPLGRRAVLVLAATVAVLVASPSFFVHYVALTAPWTALVLGIGAGVLIARIRRRGVAVVVVALVTAGVAAPTLARDLLPAAATPSLRPLALAAAGVEGCVRSDDPGLLAALGVLSRDLGRGCEVWPDVTGWTFDRQDLPTVSAERPASTVWQAFVLDYLLGGDAVIVDREGTGLSDASTRRIGELPELAGSGPLVLRGTAR
jgi:alpha-1,2-mannosyltransferase